MQLIFWQNIISPHQAPYMRKLADMGHEVTVVATEAMSPERLRMGWQVPSLGAAKIVLGPIEQEVAEIVRGSATESVHFMAGARWTKLGSQSFAACRKLERRVGIVSEAPDPRGLGLVGRWFKYALEAAIYGPHFDFLLCMGERGLRWFRRCGYSSSKLFPFCYVTDPSPAPQTQNDQSLFRILFAGRLLYNKGPDLLVRAFAAAALPSARLVFIGDGPQKPKLTLLAARLGITNLVEWHGFLAPEETKSKMTSADLFVLPSRHDGWGAVVNEALSAGTPVVCSSACGAADLIRFTWLGAVFQAGNVRSLTAAVTSWGQRGRHHPNKRDAIRWWCRCIDAPHIATYLLNIMDHVYGKAPRPEVPWRAQAASITQDLLQS